MEKIETETKQAIPEREQLERFRAAHLPRRFSRQGIEWEYYLAGSGPETVLILTGLLGVAELSFQQIMALEDDYRVIVPSYPASIKTTAGLLDGIASILEAEGIARYHVIGGSYGGLLAQALVRRFPERVDKLVIAHTGVPEKERAGKNRRLNFLLSLMPMSWLRNLLSQATHKSLEDAPQVLPFWEPYTQEILNRLTKADILARYQVAADYDATCAFTPQDLRDWPGKILILEGDNDAVADEADRRALKALYPQARVHTFHGTGHIAAMANFAEYIGVIKDFLRS